jgi:hypothetical protein
VADANSVNVESKAASREKLWTLYVLLLDALLEHFSNPSSEGVTAAFLNVARQFLKDQGISVAFSQVKDLQRSLGELRALSLPFVNPNEENEQ